MQCPCSREFTTFQKFNQHRRVCAVYRAAIFKAAEQITIGLVGQPALISKADWDAHRPTGFPAAATLREWWGDSWAAFQRDYAAAVGVQEPVASKGGRRPAQPPVLDTSLPAGQFVSRDVPIVNVLLLINAAYGTEFTRRVYAGLQSYSLPSRAATRRYGTAI